MNGARCSIGDGGDIAVPYLPTHWLGFELLAAALAARALCLARWTAGHIALTLGMRCGVHRASFAGFGTTYSLTSSPHG
jgi:hypothetical protein